MALAVRRSRSGFAGRKRKGSGCKGRNVKEEELLKFGDAARIVVKDDGIEIL